MDNNKNTNPFPQININKQLSAEAILKWLEEANQFVRAFLSPEDIQKWRKAKSKIPNRIFPK